MTFSATSAPIQYAAVRAYAGGAEIEDYLVRARRVLAGLVRWAAGVLRERGIAVVQPAGAFYLFPNVSGLGHNSKVIADRLLDEAGVAALPGTAFGVHGEGYLRFSFANSLANIEAALERIRGFVNTL